MIQFLNLHDVNAPYEHAIQDAVDRVIASGTYIRGNEVSKFENEYAHYIGSTCCVGVGNGLDALKLIYKAYIQMGCMQPGDEVIVPANTYIASILAVSECGLKPVMVEPRADTLQIDSEKIEAAVTERTKSLMIVHLYGRCAYNEQILDICKRHRLKLVEDNAQGHGCCFNRRHTGALGDAAAHSFYPTKNLGALGDGGAVTTDDATLADIIRAMANYGSAEKYHFQYKGCNSRLDELQAAILRMKLPHLDDDNAHRRQAARYYLQHIDNEFVTLPAAMDNEQNVWHQFPVFCEEREAFLKHMHEKGVETQIHYPIPPHKQPCYEELQKLQLPVTEWIHACEVSLPMSAVITNSELEFVVEALNSFKS